MRFWLLATLLLAGATPAWAGKLRNAASSARGGTSGTNPRANPPPSGRPADTTYPTTSGADAFYGLLIWNALRLPVLIPQLVLESHGPQPFVYEPKPYARRSKGIVRKQKLLADEEQLVLVAAEDYGISRGPPDERAWMPGEAVYDGQESFIADEEPAAVEDETIVETAPPPPPPQEDWTSGGQTWAAQLSFDGAYIDSDTQRLRPRLRLFTPSRIELDAETSVYREALHGADRFEAGRDVDWLTVSTLRLGIRFAQSQAVQFRLSAGPRLMTTPDAAFMGWDLTYGFEAFPIQPLILAGSAGMGTLGQAFVTELRGSIGIVVSAVEIMVGGERLQIGDTVLAGPTAGIRFWF